MALFETRARRGGGSEIHNIYTWYIPQGSPAWVKHMAINLEEVLRHAVRVQNVSHTRL